MKLIRKENETAALSDWLSERPERPVVSSELGRVEVFRAARRVGDRALTEARAVIGDIRHLVRWRCQSRARVNRHELGVCSSHRVLSSVSPKTTANRC